MTIDASQTPMEKALNAAKKAALEGEVPVGAVLVSPEGAVLSVAANRTERDKDPTAHAEMLAIKEACSRLGDARLEGCALYVTLEPCAMCAGAIAHARIKRLYFGAYDPKGGGVDHGARVFDRATCLHKPEVYGGMMEVSCAALLKDFFAVLREG